MLSLRRVSSCQIRVEILTVVSLVACHQRTQRRQFLRPVRPRQGPTLHSRVIHLSRVIHRSRTTPSPSKTSCRPSRAIRTTPRSNRSRAIPFLVSKVFLAMVLASSQNKRWWPGCSGSFSAALVRTTSI